MDDFAAANMNKIGDGASGDGPFPVTLNPVRFPRIFAANAFFFFPKETGSVCGENDIRHA